MGIVETLSYSYGYSGNTFIVIIMGIVKTLNSYSYGYSGNTFIVILMGIVEHFYSYSYGSLVYRYIIAVSQMTSDMYPLHYTHKNNYKSVSTIPIRITIKVFPLYP
jgi:hypothetical protein